jgi:5-methyltetrahydrofolate--homocysteine methyltransferase
MSDLSEMAIAIRAARAVHTWPVIATYAFGRSPGRVFRTMMGTTVSEAVGAAIQAGADIVGANCGTALSLDDYADLAAEMVASAGKVPVILQPNAGSPQQINGKLSYGATPEDMATLARRMLAAGVRIIGGCCGTGPAHVSAMRIARDERQWPA